MVDLKGWEKIFGAEKTPTQTPPSTHERVRDLHIALEGVKALHKATRGVSAMAMYSEMAAEIVEELHELGETPGE